MLALEAEVQRQPRSVEAWRLLGTVHAENDDDIQVRFLFAYRWPSLRLHCSVYTLKWSAMVAELEITVIAQPCRSMHSRHANLPCCKVAELESSEDQPEPKPCISTPVQAIAAMDRALEADPGNLEVLLSLGVSHVNELDAAEALSYLHRWITAHPTHGPAAAAAPGPPDSSQRHAYVVRALCPCLHDHQWLLLQVVAQYAGFDTLWARRQEGLLAVCWWVRHHQHIILGCFKPSHVHERQCSTFANA